MKHLVILVAFLILVAAVPVRAVEGYVPIVLRPEQTSIRVWTLDGITYAMVTLTFPDSGYAISDWGQVERNGNTFTVDIKPERWTGGALTVITTLEHVYTLGALTSEGGQFYSFAVRSRGVGVKTVTFNPANVTERWEPATLPANHTGIALRTTGGVTFFFLSLYFPDDGYRVVDWGRVERSGNNLSIDIKLDRRTGRVTTRTVVAQQYYSVASLEPGAYSLNITYRGTPGRTQTFTVGDAVWLGHPLDDPVFFVWQHYQDFLNREPDPGGLTFWSDNIINPCRGLSACIVNSRLDPSAAFFLSIEFKETGFFIHRLYKAAFGRVPRFAEFMPDTRAVSRDVVVGAPGWESKLEANKRAFISEFVTRPAFTDLFPETLTPEQYVNLLTVHTGGAMPGEKQSEMVLGLRNGTESRASLLRMVAEDEAFTRAEFNPAFVLMQYFGYLRRDPDAAPDNNLDGYNFWLNKLNEFGGDFRRAEMVKAFVNSHEYRARFTQAGR